MKKLLFVIISLLVPYSISAEETSVGIGYNGKVYSAKDNLGVNNLGRLIVPNHSEGLSLNYTHLFDNNSALKTGINLSFGYGWLLPQIDKLGTKSLQNWDITIGSATQYSNKHFNLIFKGSIIVNGLNSQFIHKRDVDTGLVFGIRTIVESFGDYRIFIEPQVIINTGTEAYSQYPVICPSIIVGIDRIFQTKKEYDIIEISVIELPKETTATAEKPKKLALKFNDNNLDSQESSDFLQTILNIHNKSPSVINIYHSKGDNAKIKADALKAWFLQHNAKEQEVIVFEGLKGKEIKIEVIKKE